MRCSQTFDGTSNAEWRAFLKEQHGNVIAEFYYVADTTARRYCRWGASIGLCLEDLRDTALAHMKENVWTWKPGGGPRGGMKLRDYLISAAKRGILTLIRDTNPLTHGRVEFKMRVAEATAELREKLGTTPSLDELAVKLGRKRTGKNGFDSAMFALAVARPVFFSELRPDDDGSSDQYDSDYVGMDEFISRYSVDTARDLDRAASERAGMRVDKRNNAMCLRFITRMLSAITDSGTRGMFFEHLFRGETLEGIGHNRHLSKERVRQRVILGLRQAIPQGLGLEPPGLFLGKHRSPRWFREFRRVTAELWTELNELQQAEVLNKFQLRTKRRSLQHRAGATKRQLAAVA